MVLRVSCFSLLSLCPLYFGKDTPRPRSQRVRDSCEHGPQGWAAAPGQTHSLLSKAFTCASLFQYDGGAREGQTGNKDNTGIPLLDSI